IFYSIFVGTIEIIASASLFFSIDVEKDPSLVDGIFNYLREKYAMIYFKSKFGTLEILSGTFLVFIFFYTFIVLFLRNNVYKELEEVR
ncbi:hypothetical protein PENTCL1PPCAC_19420, partial [Pristionchus entomophagus]